MIETTLRLRGFREVLSEAGTELAGSRVSFTDYTPRQVRSVMKRLVESGGGSDAIFFCSDYMAVTAMEFLHAVGIRIPEDVAVIGYDDVPLADHSTPKLTTVRQEIDLGGRTMARKLVELLRGESPAAANLPVRLVVRDSAPFASEGSS